MNDEDRTKEQLARELEGLRRRYEQPEVAELTRAGKAGESRQSQIELVFRRIRNAARSMETPDDWENVLHTVVDELSSIGVSFRWASVLLADWDEGATYGFGRRYLTDVPYRVSRQSIPSAMRSAMDSGEVVYRPDVWTEDPYGELDRVRHLDIHSIIDVPFVFGTIGLSHTVPNAFSDENIDILTQIAEALSDGFHRAKTLETLEQRNRDLEHEITERERAEEALRRRAALDRVRAEVFGMTTAEDMDRVLTAIYRELRSLGVEFNNCSISVFKEGGDPPEVESYCVSAGAVWTSTASVTGSKHIEAMWRAAGPVYRKDLDREDVYGEKENADRAWGRPIRSIVDVPFSKGSIAINSVEPDAFSENDIEILQQFAGVLSEAYARFEDMMALRRLNTEMRAEIAERKRAEAEKEQLIKELQEALAEIKTLRGIIPICASCKKIRDDKGYWHQVEVYVRDHSEAEFSHSLCPECAKKLYPEFYKEKDTE